MSRIIILISTIHACLKRPRAKATLAGLMVWTVTAAVLWFWLPYQPRFTLPGTEDSAVAGFSPDGRILATKLNKPKEGYGRIYGEENGPVRLWDIDTGQEIGIFSTKGGFAYDVDFSPDGRILVISIAPPDHTDPSLSIIDRVTRRELAEIKHIGDYFERPRFTPDGKCLCFTPSGENRRKTWDIDAGRESSPMNWRSVCNSPDGRWFVSKESAYEANLRDSETQISKINFESKTPLGLFTFSSDGRLLAADMITKIKVWITDTQEEISPLEGVTDPKFSRNGKRLTARAVDEEGRAFKLWDTSNWKEVGTFQLPDPGLSAYSLLAGPGPEDLRVAVFRNRGSSPGIVERSMAQYLGFKNMGTSKMFHQLRVFDIASGKDLADFSTEGEIHLLPDGGAFVVDSSGPGWPRNQPKKCISVFNIPPRRPIAHITLWPLPFAFASSMIFWFLISSRTGKKKP